MSDPSSGAAMQSGVTQSQTLTADTPETSVRAPSRERARPGRRVLIIVENLPLPFDRRVWQEARTLAAAGYLVSIICPKGKSYEKSYEELDGIAIYRHPMPFEGNGALGYLTEYTWALLAEFALSLRVLME